VVAPLLVPKKPSEAEVSEIAWKAQERLHKKFAKMRYHGKPSRKVATAVARGLVGFIWAIGTLVERQAMAKATLAEHGGAKKRVRA
jgi:hypothetical protein